MAEIVTAGAIIVLVVLGATGLTAAASVMMKRDQGSTGSSGLMAGAMMEVQSLIEPSKRHVVRVVRAEDPSGREAGEGNPPGMMTDY